MPQTGQTYFCHLKKKIEFAGYFDSLKNKRLKRSFFKDHPKNVAPKLLGKFLVVDFEDKKVVAKIVETEAYGGKEDKACHVGRFGFTKRTVPLFGEVGRAYVYSVYINTYCLNVVAHKDKEAGGVLIRALEPLEGIEIILKNLNKTPTNYDFTKLLNGPGKLCKALRIDKNFNGEDLVEGRRIFITEGEKINNNQTLATPRINIPYAGIARKWKWRFVVKGSRFLSRDYCKL
jgi:DNA-3-methyladenine glycosylase